MRYRFRLAAVGGTVGQLEFLADPRVSSSWIVLTGNDLTEAQARLMAVSHGMVCGLKVKLADLVLV